MSALLWLIVVGLASIPTIMLSFERGYPRRPISSLINVVLADQSFLCVERRFHLG